MPLVTSKARKATRATLVPSARLARRVSKALKAPQAIRVPLAHRVKLVLVVSKGLKATPAQQVQTAKMPRKLMTPP